MRRIAATLASLLPVVVRRLFALHLAALHLAALFFGALHLAALYLGAGCHSMERGEDEGTLPRPARVVGRAPDADLLALLPDGADLVATVDLDGLRRLAKGQPWAADAARAGAPLAARVKAVLDQDLLSRAEVLVLALWLDEGGTGQILLLARGGPDQASGSTPDAAPPTGKAHGAAPPIPRAAGAAPPASGATGAPPGVVPPARRSPMPLGELVRSRLRGPAVEWERYRGVDLASFGEEATALPTPRTVVSGPKPLVKHALDLLREVPGFSSVREDRELMALWRLVADPAEGRPPAIALVSRFPAPMRSRLSARLGLRSPPLRAGLRMSAAAWITVRAFLDCPDKASAQAVIEGLQKVVQRAARGELVRRLGIGPLFQLLAVHQEGARVHGQWIAPLASLDPHLTRVLGLLRLERPADRPQAFPKPTEPPTR